MLLDIKPLFVLAALTLLPGSGDGGYARAADKDLLYRAADYNCETTDTMLDDALKGDEDRLLAKLEGQRINDFANYLTQKGWFSGTMSGVDAIYIITAKMRPGFEDHPSVWLFFIVKHCVVTKVGAERGPIEEAIK